MSDTSKQEGPVTRWPADLDGADLDGADLDGGDLDAALAARASHPASRTTLALAGVVLIVAGFLGGVLVQRQVGVSSGGQAGGAAAAAFGRGGSNGDQIGGDQIGGGAANGGQTSAAGGGNQTTTGTVTLVDGGTIYLTLTDGTVVTVKTSASTAVTKQRSAALADLTVGSTVTVQGSANADGVITATKVVANG